MGQVRIIEKETVDLAAGQYIIVDSAADGAGKIELKGLMDGKAGTATATTTTPGLMSAGDKSKLDGVEPNATANAAGSAAPLMDGTATAGSAATYARSDHRHPTDTSRAPLASPAFTGVPTAPTAEAGTDTDQVATTAFVQGELDAYEVPDGSVTLDKLGEDVTGELDGKASAADVAAKPDAVLEATVTTAQTVADAWPAPPRGAVLYGKSVQDGTPAPDNPVPVQVVGGANLMSLNAYYTGNMWYSLSAGYVFTPGSDSTVTVDTDGEDVSITSTNNWRGAVYISDKLTSGKTYTVSISHGESTGYIGRSVYTLDADFAIVRNINNNTSNPLDRLSETITLASGEAYIAFGIGIRQVNGVVTFAQLQVREGSAVLPFVPYGCIGIQVGDTVVPVDLQGNTLASLPAGTRDELRIECVGNVGHVELVQNVGVRQFDGTESWVKDTSVSSRTQFYCTDNSVKHEADYRQTLLCDMLEIAQNSYMQNMPANSITAYHNTQGKYPGQNWWYAYVDGVTDAAGMKTWMAANTPTVYYELATPVTHDLGYIDLPELAQPCTLAFYASLDPEWSITYEQDPNAVVNGIEGSIAAVEGAVASANHAAGTYLMFQNSLYKATTAIAAGESIVPGTNCTQTTVMAELLALTS